MDLLQQVGPAIGIGLIGSGKPREKWPAKAIRLFIQCVLLAAIQWLLEPIVNSRAEEEDSYTRTVYFGSGAGRNSRFSQARLNAQSRSIVRGEIFITALISSTFIPPK